MRPPSEDTAYSRRCVAASSISPCSSRQPGMPGSASVCLPPPGSAVTSSESSVGVRQSACTLPRPIAVLYTGPGMDRQCAA